MTKVNKRINETHDLIQLREKEVKDLFKTLPGYNVVLGRSDFAPATLANDTFYQFLLEVLEHYKGSEEDIEDHYASERNDLTSYDQARMIAIDFAVTSASSGMKREYEDALITAQELASIETICNMMLSIREYETPYHRIGRKYRPAFFASVIMHLTETGVSYGDLEDLEPELIINLAVHQNRGDDSTVSNNG